MKPKPIGSRIGSIRNGTPQPVELVDAAIERVERGAEIGNDDDARAAARQVARDVEVRAVDAEHELGAGVDGVADLRRVEGVDADAHARAGQLPNDVAERGKRQTRRAADVDDVGTGGAERLGRLRECASRVRRGALLISARISMSHAP